MHGSGKDGREDCGDDVVQNTALKLVHEGCNRGQEDQLKEKKMLVVYEQQIGIALRSRSLCAQARIQEDARRLG